MAKKNLDRIKRQLEKGTLVIPGISPSSDAYCLLQALCQGAGAPPDTDLHLVKGSYDPDADGNYTIPCIDIDGNPAGDVVLNGGVSADTGNLLVVGSDGKPYLDCAGVLACINFDNVSGSGTADDPFVAPQSSVTSVTNADGSVTYTHDDGDGNSTSWTMPATHVPSSLATVTNADGSITVTHSDGNGNDVSFVIPAPAASSSITSTTNADGSITFTHDDGAGNTTDWVIPAPVTGGNTSSVTSVTNADGSVEYTHDDGTGTTTSWTVPAPPVGNLTFGWNQAACQFEIVHTSSNGTTQTQNVKFGQPQLIQSNGRRALPNQKPHLVERNGDDKFSDISEMRCGTGFSGDGDNDLTVMPYGEREFVISNSTVRSNEVIPNNSHIGAATMEQFFDYTWTNTLNCPVLVEVTGQGLGRMSNSAAGGNSLDPGADYLSLISHWFQLGVGSTAGTALVEPLVAGGNAQSIKGYLKNGTGIGSMNDNYDSRNSWTNDAHFRVSALGTLNFRHRIDIGQINSEAEPFPFGQYASFRIILTRNIRAAF